MCGFDFKIKEVFEAKTKVLIELVVKKNVEQIRDHVKEFDGVRNQVADLDAFTADFLIKCICLIKVEKDVAGEFGDPAEEVKKQRVDDHLVGLLFRLLFIQVYLSLRSLGSRVGVVQALLDGLFLV